MCVLQLRVVVRWWENVIIDIFFFKWAGSHRDLHGVVGRNRQMCIGDSLWEPPLILHSQTPSQPSQHLLHRNPEWGFRCPYRSLSVLPWPKAHPCGYVRTYWPKHQSSYRWGSLCWLDWDAGAGWTWGLMGIVRPAWINGEFIQLSEARIPVLN